MFGVKCGTNQLISLIWTLPSMVLLSIHLSTEVAPIQVRWIETIL